MHHHKDNYYLDKEKNLDSNANISKESRISLGKNNRLYVKNSNRFEKNNNKSERNKNIYKDKGRASTCQDKHI
jgi:hypothetical protein